MTIEEMCAVIDQAQAELDRRRRETVEQRVIIDELRAELATTDRLLRSANETLALLPECPTHGPCHPWRRAWLQQLFALAPEVQAMIVEVEKQHEYECQAKPLLARILTLLGKGTP
jgi:hypothetical protein